VDLTAQILLQIAAVETSTADLSATVTTTNVSRSISFATGTGANQAQVAWSDSRTIDPSGEDIPDLAALDDARGTVAFTAIKLIYIRNTGTQAINWNGNGDWDTGPEKLPDTANYEIPPAGIYLASNPSAAGWAVGASGQYLTLVNNGGTAASYDILLIGEGSIV